MIKALFFDIDGTLVSFNTHAIPQTTIEAIAAAKAKGIRIFIATGRPAVIINNLSALQDRGLIDGYITMNGGYCFVGEEVIYKSAIPAADVQTLARISSEQKFPCIFVGEHDICVCQPDDMVKKIFNDYLKVDVLPVKTPEEAIRQEIFQMTPFITLEQEKEMLRHAAIGVAMGNAVDEVKEHANYITTSVDEDGVANALKHFSII